MTIDIKRHYTTNRMSIVEALASKLKDIDGSGEFVSNLYGNVSSRLKFWDEVEDYPSVHLNAGSERREYQGAGYKDRFLTVTVRCYVNEEDAVVALESLLEDVETVVETHSRLEYTDNRGNTQFTQQISIAQIDTDEGVLEPYGVGEVLLLVRY